MGREGLVPDGGTGDARLVESGSVPAMMLRELHVLLRVLWKGKESSGRRGAPLALAVRGLGTRAKSA